VWTTLVSAGFVVSFLLLPGLRGTASGLGSAIDALSNVSAVLAQLLGLIGLMLVVHLELAVLRSGAPLVVRAASVPATALVATLLMNAAVDALTPKAVLLLGASSGSFALAVGAASLFPRRRATAWAGTLLITAGAVTLLSVGSRLGAFIAQERRLPAAELFSRWVSTGAFALMLALVATVLWHRSQVTKRGSHGLLALLSVALLVSLAATQVTAAGAAEWQVLLTRAATSLTRPPLPFLPTATVTFGQLLGLGAALWILGSSSLPLFLRVVGSLSLLSTQAPDVPLLSLALTLAALAAASVQARKSTQSRNEAHRASAPPVGK
jgi:hypothetical protein